MRVFVHPLRIAALLLIGCSAFGAERAFEGTHVELDVASVDNNPSGAASSASIGAGVTATVPLGRYFGVALGGDYMHTRVRTGEIFEATESAATLRPNCSFDSLGGAATLMFRLPQYFRLSAGYSSVDLSADCSGDSIFTAVGRDRADTEGLRFGAEAYLGDFTLGVERLQTTLGDGPELRSMAIAASWYPLDSLKIELSGSDLYDAEIYGLLVEHQLEMLGDGFAIRLGFSLSDVEPRSRTFELGLSYYFGRKVPLKARDRNWR